MKTYWLMPNLLKAIFGALFAPLPLVKWSSGFLDLFAPSSSFLNPPFPILKSARLNDFFLNCSFRNLPREEEHGGALSMFFRSLLPSFYSQTADGQRERLEMRLEQPVEGAEGGPRPLRDTELARGVENLMVAMRELLNTLSYRGQPEGEQGDDAGENEEEWEEGQEDH